MCSWGLKAESNGFTASLSELMGAGCWMVVATMTEWKDLIGRSKI